MVQASQKWGLCFDSGRQNNLNKESFDQPEKSNSNWFIINEYNHQRLRFSIRNVSLKVQWNIYDMIFLQFSFCTSSCMWYSMWLKKHGEAVRQRLPAAVAEVTALSLISQQPVVLWQHVNMQKKKKTLRLYNWLALIHIHTVIGPLRLLHAHSTWGCFHGKCVLCVFVCRLTCI